MLRRRTRWSFSALAPLLSVALAVPASATDQLTEDPAPAPALESEAGRHSSNLRESALTAPAAGSAAYFTVDERTRPVAPGLDLTSFDRYDARGWIRVDALTADLSTPGLRLDYASPGKVSSTAPLTSSLHRDRAVAGVNGDFFDIGDTGAPLGVGVDRQRGVLHGSSTGWVNSFTLDAQNAAAVARTYLEASIVRRGKRPIPVTNLNSATVATNGIGLYTSAWGNDARNRVLPGASARREVVVVRGRVRANRKALGQGPIARDTMVLVGTGNGARQLRSLRRGTRVSVKYGVNTEATQVAIGGGAFLLRRGDVVAPPDPAMHPRTAIGVDTDKNQVIIVTVDGRQGHSRGLTLQETAVLLRRLGAEEALNLDGGGSSTMLARESGEPVTVVNEPSDGGLRSVPNGLGFAMADGSGRLRGIRVEPVTEATDSHRVLRGLSRVLVARGHDETFDPVRARPTWRGSAAVSVRQGPGQRTVVVGRRTGTGVVTANARRTTGEFRVTVLGRVHRLETGVSSMALAGRSASQSFDVRGYDARGFGTWVDPRDVRLSYDHDKLRVRRTGQGFTVTSLRRSASDVIQVSAGGRSTYIGVTVGLARRVVDRMGSLRGWKATAFPAKASARLSLTKNRRGRAGEAIAMRYSLVGARRTRAAYLTATPARALPADARRIGLWVRGDGKGAWLRLVARDQGGARATLNLSRRVTWRGWRFVSTALPAGLTQPLEFVRVYAVETKRSRKYAGTLGFDDLTVWSERTAPVPDTPPLRDPMVADLAPMADGGLRVAVLSDAGIRAAAPNGGAVKRTRRAMREIVATDPDLVLINGDLVARGTRADLNLARRLIQEELAGKVEWRYVPGDQEIGESGDLTNFRAEFGQPVQTFERGGTRFVLLNSAPGSFRLGGFPQLVRLRSALSSAQHDQSVHSVVVVAHHPTSDPNTGGSAEVADPREGELVEGLLADFRARSGKNVAYVGSHARRFGLTRHDDVPLLMAGPVNDPARSGSGSFAGWSLLRVDPADRSWLGAEFRPTVNALRIDAPGTLSAGRSAEVAVTVTQAGHRMTLGYPMAAHWLPSRTLHVGPPRNAPGSAVAAYNPRTGQLTGLRAGETTLTIRVNGVSASSALTVR